MIELDTDAITRRPLPADTVLECLTFIARQYDRPSSPVLLKAGLALDQHGRMPFHQAERALEHVGMRGDPSSKSLKRLRNDSLPAILRMHGGGAIVLLEIRDGDGLVFEPGRDTPHWTPIDELAAGYDGAAVL